MSVQPLSCIPHNSYYLGSIFITMYGRFKLVLCLLLLSSSLKAATLGSFSEKNLLEISQETKWRYLLGYTKLKRSNILTEEFFLSKKGRQDPFAELIATLSAFALPKESLVNINDHAQCRFRARYFWLSEYIDFSAHNIEAVYCSDFEAFSYNNKTTSISLIFATGFLGNPASYYGHMLLKLNTDEHAITNLEETSVNFGAIYPSTESIPAYILKGIFGGYQSTFTHQQYYSQNLSYGEVDLRDIWEYELQLSDKEVLLATAHVWELLDKKYRYYFFNRNCAFYMASVIQLVLDEKLTNNFRPWQTPQRLLQQLNKIHHSGAPLIKSIRYIPSRQSRLYKRFLALDEEQKQWVSLLIKDESLLNSDEFDSLDGLSKQLLVDVLIDYYQYLHTKEYIDEQTFKRNNQALLIKRFTLPSTEAAVKFKSDASPHAGRKASYSSLGYVYRESTSGAAIKLRPAYYDSLDFDSGHLKNSSLAMGELDLESVKDRWYVESVGLIRVESLPRNTTYLPGDRVNSWYLDVNFSRPRSKDRYESCSNCLVPDFSGGAGYSKSFVNDQVLGSVLFGGGVLGSKVKDALFVSGRFIGHWNLSSSFRLRVEMEHSYYPNDKASKSSYRLEARQALSTNTDIRLKVDKSDELVMKLSSGFYW